MTNSPTAPTSPPGNAILRAMANMPVSELFKLPAELLTSLVSLAVKSSSQPTTASLPPGPAPTPGPPGPAPATVQTGPLISPGFEAQEEDQEQTPASRPTQLPQPKFMKGHSKLPGHPGKTCFLFSHHYLSCPFLRNADSGQQVEVFPE